MNLVMRDRPAAIPGSISLWVGSLESDPALENLT
jgi:hypothetical protein